MKELNINLGAIESVTLYQEVTLGYVKYPEIKPRKWMGIVWNDPKPEIWWKPYYTRPRWFGLTPARLRKEEDVHFHSDNWWYKPKCVVKMLSGKKHIKYFSEYEECKKFGVDLMQKAENLAGNKFLLLEV